MSEARVGISGWRYKGWRGVFYPKGLRQADELAYAAARMTSIEVNGSFYSLQRPANWQRWRDGTPDGFVYAVKGPRFVTHIKRLRDIEAPLANFFASGVLDLGPKLGPVLWQLPPTLAFDAGLLDAFLGRLPRSRADAAALAARHDERMEGRASFGVGEDAGIRHAVEVRHPSFEDAADEWGAVLERHGVASVTADTAGRYPRLDRTTADFAYARLHGEEELYASGYDAESLDRWAAWTRTHLDAGRDAYLYFDNDIKVRAPYDAMGLIARLPLPPGLAAPATEAG
ncbi:uncharacterized protein YecE (DUF72 family) [Agromyces flavus]|uniref:Uncharacterized conserved protein YecE, DUF72 family n=1 Tax=Agromyces flavus TaxID=589382 RepID=A0A1H1LVE7_9MICO|nr:DUF72 domain-containing protein [Agromyces flavus]MCP2368645.1 uncharacterized protein YecE (DUF72 family) [Agromyces flavus]GGI48115.1 hypothetical protein GCM10010932_28030 [Agromyces flavus]SDR78483.1 Uncharacterized conserved protein YecE, DUF72 family [Agromyces flavus]